MPSATSADNAGTETTSSQRTVIGDLARGALAETEADGETVKMTVLHELYRHQPAVSLEDVLELNVLIAAPEPGPLEERVAAVLTEAVAQHDSWTDTPQAPSASESTSVPTTEGH
ncbi:MULTISPECIES: hypothetical protein [Halococcus]|uniref:Uncharacterized protein n=1 Tax=Halococcus salifodinae DSM 8989 TaxID=1227456 RepID=M0NBF2_9EURY|nr:MULTISPECIES: hypothetical protein [Halococcus]EMA54893.1 hypothetical protein C450_04428 [Halococcus salifodinae DSM 8989]